MNTQRHDNIALKKLSETNLDLADPSQDIRGRKVIDRDGSETGHISALFVDEADRRVRMLEISGGGFLGMGDRHYLLPVDAIERVTKDEVRISETRERVAGSPAYDPELVDVPTRENWEPFYGYYGLSPYWGTGYLYPNFPMTTEESNRSVYAGHKAD
jgi:sporulation protein YlmC with PRC-barrel domain